MSTGYAAAQAIADELTGLGLRATVDPRSAQPPCILVTPPVRNYTLGCGWSAEWTLVLLSTGTGADSFKVLDDWLDQLAAHVDIETARPSAYQLVSGGDPIPAYLVTVTEAIA
jgi:hypothetical protein